MNYKIKDIECLDIKERSIGLVSNYALLDRLKSGRNISLNGTNGVCLVGEGSLIKVNTSVGISTPGELEREANKIKAITSCSYAPDIMMDLSICHSGPRLYEVLCSMFGGPVGTLPHYLLNGSQKQPIDELFRIMERQVKAGVSFITIHPTPTYELIELSKKERRVPITSRGGGIVIRDMFQRRVKQNFYAEFFDSILGFCHENDVALSIGTSFRPSTIHDTLDATHLYEIQAQKKFIEKALIKGVKVLFEIVGHSSLDKIIEMSDIVKKVNVPMMALGPIVTDQAIGFDHVANAIGSSFMAYNKGTHIINSITREEHTGGVPSLESVLEGLKSAKLSAHSVNIAFFDKYKKRELCTSIERYKKNTCVVNGGLFDNKVKKNTPACKRCGEKCPLL